LKHYQQEIFLTGEAGVFLAVNFAGVLLITGVVYAPRQAFNASINEL